MAWEAPTTNDFTGRFAEFETADDDLIESLLEVATREVGSSWIEADRTEAVLHLVAHWLTREGHSSSGPIDPATGALMKSRTVGDVSVTFETGSGGRGGGESGGPFSTTLYGQRYLELRARSFPTVLII